MNHARVVAVVTAVASLMAGCSQESTPKAATATTLVATSGLPCGKLGPAPPTARSGPPVRTITRGDFPFEAEGTISSLTMWGHYLAYVFHGRREGPEAAVCDLANGRLVTVAKLHGAWEPFWVHGHGTTIVYNEIDRASELEGSDDGSSFIAGQANTPPPPGTRFTGMDWKVYSYDLQTGQRRELARSHSKDDTEKFVVPIPAVEGRWVAWKQATGGPTGEPSQYRVVSFDLKTGKTRTIGTGVGPSNVTLAGGVVYFNNLDDRDPPHLMLWAAKADGSSPQAVVPGVEDVLEPDVRGGLATWASYVARTREPEDRHYPIIARRLGSQGGSVTLGRGARRSTSTGTLALWRMDDTTHEGKLPEGWMVADPTFPDRPLKVASSRDVVYATGDGDLIAWVAPDKRDTRGKRLRIEHVVR